MVDRFELLATTVKNAKTMTVNVGIGRMHAIKVSFHFLSALVLLFNPKH